MGSRASPQGDAFPEGPLEAVWCSHSVFCLRAWSLSKEELRSPGIRVKLVTVTNGATGKSEPRILVAAAKLLLSHFSRVRLCVTPWTAAHQAPPSLGFSRQEHWSGLPFPSPVHESEK